MSKYHHTAQVTAHVSDVFAWYSRPGAFDLLSPPWVDVDVVQSEGGIRDNGIVVLQLKSGPLKLLWKLRHSGYVQDHQFQDQQVSGPFQSWQHTHKFLAGQGGCTVDDYIEYRVPLDFPVAPRMINHELDRLFKYRGSVLSYAMEEERVAPMNIVVSGSRGLIGRVVCPALTTAGHTIKRLVRGESKGQDEIEWDPRTGSIDAQQFDNVDAVIHLAGESIASGRWSAQKKEELRKSRIETTRALCQSIANLPNPPKVFVCASAIGFYGDSGSKEVDESSPQGDLFLSSLCQEWEAACAPARERGIRVVNLRFGVVLSPRGGALAQMLLPFSMGAGGNIGSGQQYMSWVAIDDVAHVVTRAVSDERLSGPINVTAPYPVTNAQFTKTLGKVLSRPTICPVPAFGARIVFGEMADELLLASCRAVPSRLQSTGFQFQFPQLEPALRHVLGK